MTEILEALFLFVTGIIAGSYGSVVGGGTLISFPVLILLGYPVEVAVATNRFNAIFMEASSVVAYSRKKLVQWKYALPLALAAVPTSILGAQLIIGVQTRTINIIVAAALVSLLFVLPRISALKPKNGKSHPTVPYKSKKFLQMTVATLVLALYGGFYGAGFGTFILFPFALIGGSSLLQASANARFVGLFMSSAATAIFINEGLVDFSAGVPQLLGAIIGAQIGVRVATAVDSVWIKRSLIAVVLLSAGKLIIESF